jgi:hypothetical protein
MKIENQVCTLEQAKRLKELGVAQKGDYGYIEIPSNGCPVQAFWQKGNYALIRTGIVMWGGNGERKWIALTAEQLGELLNGQRLPFHWKLWDGWCFKIKGNVRGYESEVCARAEMLIELLENKLVTPEEINNRLNS